MNNKMIVSKALFIYTSIWFMTGYLIGSKLGAKVFNPKS